MPKICAYWSCETPIRCDHIFCYEHYEDLQNGLIDACPKCNRGKDVQYDLCLECNRKAHAQPKGQVTGLSANPGGWASVKPGRSDGKATERPVTRATEASRRYAPEHSDAWGKGDTVADQFFVYILKLNGGNFYAGQTRELRERLSEHRDGKVASTAGKNPKLVWFGVVSSRQEATTIEVVLKKLVDNNPREVRRMMIKFRDLIQELDYS